MKLRDFLNNFNDAGKRNFCILLTEEQADDLRAQGVAVKVLPPRTEEDEPLRIVRIQVKLDSMYPPKFMIYTGDYGSRNRSTLDPNDCGKLDHLDILDAKVEFNVSSKGGRYLRSLKVLVSEDSATDDWD